MSNSLKAYFINMHYAGKSVITPWGECVILSADEENVTLQEREEVFLVKTEYFDM